MWGGRRCLGGPPLWAWGPRLWEPSIRRALGRSGGGNIELGTHSACPHRCAGSTLRGCRPTDAQETFQRRLALYERIWAGPMFERWHWLQWNFDQVRIDIETPCARHVLDALVRCDEKMPGFATGMHDRVASFGGREKDKGDYGQILRWLGELAVISHFATWPGEVEATFVHEPTAQAHGMNPEIIITTPDWRFGIEVKTPDLLEFARLRHQRETQYLARVANSQAPASPVGSVTYPRDNPVKDFLQSANAKFEDFRGDPLFYSTLFIVWDDFINEPLSAVWSPSSGLLTPNSFDRDEDGDPRTYPAVDAVVLMRQQHQFVEGLANRPSIDQRVHLLDYGDLDRFPPNVVLPLVTGREPPTAVVEALKAYLPDPRMGAEYVPAELVWWIGG